MPRLQERIVRKKGVPSSTFLVTIPKDIIIKLKWKKGDFLSVVPTSDDKVMIENTDSAGR